MLNGEKYTEIQTQKERNYTRKKEKKSGIFCFVLTDIFQYIPEKLSQLYGKNSMRYGVVHEWYHKFEVGQTNACNDV